MKARKMRRRKNKEFQNNKICVMAKYMSQNNTNSFFKGIMHFKKGFRPRSTGFIKKKQIDK